MCITFGRMWRVRMRIEDTPNACAAWMYSSSRSLSVSPRNRRHSPVQLVTPRIKHRNTRRRSARDAEVSNHCGCVSMVTCIISTAAAISKTLGMELSTV